MILISSSYRSLHSMFHVLKTAAEGTKCKIIFAHHFEPRWELVFGHFGSLIHYRPKSVIDFMRWMKWIVTYPRTAMNREKVLSAQYRAAYECAHRGSAA